MVLLGALHPRPFHLQSNVLKTEFCLDHPLEAAHQDFDLPLEIRVHHHVSGESVVVAGNSPGVNVMNHGHAFLVFHFAAKQIHVQFGGVSSNSMRNTLIAKRSEPARMRTPIRILRTGSIKSQS